MFAQWAKTFFLRFGKNSRSVMKISFPSKTIPLALFALCFLTFGLLIPWLGFYWDDWPYAWYDHVLGARGFSEVFTIDRPFLAMVYTLTAPIGGDSPLRWQLFGLVTRWLAVMAFWWSLNRLWPKHPRQAAWAAALFAVFPGFGQHWISVIYSRGYLVFAAFLASFGLMAAAVREPRPLRRWGMILLAMAGATFSHISTEYFFGIEFVRPLLLWFIVPTTSLSHLTGVRKLLQRALNVLKTWAPYFLPVAVFGIWRAFFFKSHNYSIQSGESLLSKPLHSLLAMAESTLNTFVQASLLIWTQTANILTESLSKVSTWLALGIAAAGTIIVLIYLWNLKTNYPGTEEKDSSTPPSADQWGSQAALVGFFGIIFATIPFTAAGLSSGLDFPWDRFLLAMMFGSCLLLAGLLDLLVKDGRRKIVVLSLIIGFAMGHQFETSNTFRREWNNLETFLWQMTWRMPGIEPGTMLITHQLPFYYYSDNSLSATLNWIYAPELEGRQMPYMMVFTKARLERSLPTLTPETDFTMGYRALDFHGNTSDSIAFYYSMPNCLRVMDTQISNGDEVPGLPFNLTQTFDISDPGRIIPEPETPARPPQPAFGREPEHNWCYYFEKADLARQTGNWQVVAELGREAEELGFSASHPTEWIPFIEGYAMIGDLQQAETLSRYVTGENHEYAPGVCAAWERIGQNTDVDTSGFMDNLGCNEMSNL
jgi:hypothetical protein